MKISRKQVYEYLFIMIGTSLLALGLVVFYEPNNMVTGGITGLSIVIQDYSARLGFPVRIWALNLILNIPLFLLGVKIKGYKFLAKTLFATVFLSFAMYFSDYLPAYTGDMTITAIFGGVLTGAGLGLVFRSLATTGGTDLAASIINKYLPHISLQRILFMLDSAIIALGLFVFGVTPALYAIVSVYIATKVVDTILEGLDFAKAVFIICENPQEVSDLLIKEVQRGVTAFYGKGMYSGKEKNILLCVTNVKQIIEVKRIVQSVDQNAFVIIADVREVIGDF